MKLGLTFFRCLNTASGYLVHSPLKATKIILACCVLHNVANAANQPLAVSIDLILIYFLPLLSPLLYNFCV